ncbi:hypothetical protein F0L68_15280 [Solihabitans fulvus]|uniref:Phenylalanyl-tRNA synthetase n=1 Tax=Solihabitans fulvus TaxID=1892852 RepID=A0A5B2XF71_9PSEU|nr:hypothetical protein [Solihabitans fulvus]KAA2261774.1 hypothetical protein F0L68_15280 [Solihabitans fulvus]
MLTVTELTHALSARDLTRPEQGPHAVQLLVDEIVGALGTALGSEVRVLRDHPVVPVEDNYERLGYPRDAVTRDLRYSRYVSETCMLRSHTSAMIPPALRDVAARPLGRLDVLLACPGISYRRDSVDRLHTGTPHQLDLWRVVDGPLGSDALDEAIALVLGAALPGATYRAVPTEHPYTEGGRQLDVLVDGEWVEVGECGLAAPRVLAGAGLPPRVRGVAMGLGLDRLLMLRKGIPDIRLLSASDPRIAGQLLDLLPYRPVSRHPAIVRDLSVAVAAEADAETLGDEVRDALGPDVVAVEEIRVLSETPVEDLPAAAVARLGARPGQKNVLLRVVLRDHSRTLSDEEANLARDRVYAAVHRGAEHQWATEDH